jgi:predicted  nucleic acid-binding Zn-ribbon protein
VASPDKKPIPDRMDRIEDRIEEIRTELLELTNEAKNVDSQEEADQAALISHVTALRDEERILVERLEELDEHGAVEA